MVTYRTTLQATGGNNVAIVVPETTVVSFGRGKRVPVVVTVDGDYRYRTSIAAMGGQYLISFNAQTRAATGRGAGDEVEIDLVLDDAPRTVDVPKALAAALGDDAALAAAWAKLSPASSRHTPTRSPVPRPRRPGGAGWRRCSVSCAAETSPVPSGPCRRWPVRPRCRAGGSSDCGARAH